MDGGNTHVDTTELTAFADGADLRADGLEAVANAVSQISLGPDVFGAIHRVFCGDRDDDLNEIVTKVRDAATAQEADARDARDTATHFQDVDQTQTDKFKGMNTDG